MSQLKNILFIMCDQLRWDYLSCYGHPHLETPNIDALAARGVRFTEAYCQAPLCGPSRASFYTGRYLTSHGSLANEDPLKVGELTLGDYLRAIGVRTAVVGKSDAAPNPTGLGRLQLDPQSEAGTNINQWGFEPYEVFSGLYPDPIVPPDLGYNAYLRRHGYEAENPWNFYAASARDETGQRVDGWQMRHAGLPALIPEEHSETAFTTNRAIDFLDDVAPDERWCLHLSYIKPHWPYIAPAPYHNLYTKDQILPAQRSEQERHTPHPVVDAFMRQDYSENFSEEYVRETVIPTYMGLIKQVDDHLGRLFSYMEDKGLMEETLIVFTSDHGDYLGDHWLGEKDLFHDPSVKIPLIICDPTAKADATRGTVDNRFAEAIDLIPTFIEAMGGASQPQRLEGRSLLGLIHGETPEWREYAISEIDYSDRGPRTLLDQPPYECRAYMIRSYDWKYILYEGFRPQLFDLKNDPHEYIDLGEDPAYETIRQTMHEALFTWLRRRQIRTEMPTDFLFEMGPERDETYGVMIGHW
ncbi:MAG: alkaline phosphatase family protein [Chloroflexota bacterium]